MKPNWKDYGTSAFTIRVNRSHQLHAICHQRLYENEIRYLRNCQKTFEKHRINEQRPTIEPDEHFWKHWTETASRYSTISKSWKLGYSKLSESVLRENFPQTWNKRVFWGSSDISSGEDVGEFGAMYRLPLGIGSSISEVVGFAESVLKEFAVVRGIKYSSSEL
jgi:hypothetical protein